MSEDRNITWLQVNNWVPIISSTIMIALAFGAILTRLAVIEERLGELSKDQTVMIDLFKSVETRYGEVALDVKELQVIGGIK